MTHPRSSASSLQGHNRTMTDWGRVAKGKGDVSDRGTSQGGPRSRAGLWTEPDRTGPSPLVRAARSRQASTSVSLRFVGEKNRQERKTMVSTVDSRHMSVDTSDTWNYRESTVGVYDFSTRTVPAQTFFSLVYGAPCARSVCVRHNFCCMCLRLYGPRAPCGSA